MQEKRNYIDSVLYIIAIRCYN